MNPHVALYVETLAINCWHTGWETDTRDNVDDPYSFHPPSDDEGKPDFDSPYAEEDMELFEQAAMKAELFLGNVEPLVEKIEAGHDDPIIALLLMALPNLESLVFTEIEYNFRNNEFFRTLQYISSKQDTEVLGQLVEVKLLNDNWEIANNNLRLVKSFAKLPSVKYIHARQAGETMTGVEAQLLHLDLDLDLAVGSSSVETLIIEDVVKVDARAVIDLIQGFRGLKAFSLEAQLNTEMSALRTALLAHAKQSLQTLTLTAQFCPDDCFGSFHGFEVLRRLELDHFYLGHCCAPRGARPADSLPPSLEELHLQDWTRYVEHPLDLLWTAQEILEDKNTHLPNLRVLAFCEHCWNTGGNFGPTSPGIIDLRAACVAKGFRLEVRERQDRVCLATVCRMRQRGSATRPASFRQ